MVASARSMRAPFTSTSCAPAPGQGRSERWWQSVQPMVLTPTLRVMCTAGLPAPRLRQLALRARAGARPATPGRAAQVEPIRQAAAQPFLVSRPVRAGSAPEPDCHPSPFEDPPGEPAAAPGARARSRTTPAARPAVAQIGKADSGLGAERAAHSLPHEAGSAGRPAGAVHSASAVTGTADAGPAATPAAAAGPAPAEPGSAAEDAAAAADASQTRSARPFAAGAAPGAAGGQAAAGAPLVAAAAPEGTGAAGEGGGAPAAAPGAPPRPPQGAGLRVVSSAGARASPGASPLPSPGRRALTISTGAAVAYPGPKPSGRPPPPPMFREALPLHGAGTPESGGATGAAAAAQACTPSTRLMAAWDAAAGAPAASGNPAAATPGSYSDRSASVAVQSSRDSLRQLLTGAYTQKLINPGGGGGGGGGGAAMQAQTPAATGKAAGRANRGASKGQVREGRAGSATRDGLASERRGDSTAASQVQGLPACACRGDVNQRLLLCCLGTCTCGDRALSRWAP